MASNINAFVAALQKKKEEPLRQIINLQRSIAIRILSKLQQGSPVWTGRFRGSWTVSLDSPQGYDPGEHPETTRETSPLRWPDKPKSTIRAFPQSEAGAILSRINGFSTVYLTNSVPYAKDLEDGSSAQAPQGVLRVAVAAAKVRFQGIIK